MSALSKGRPARYLITTHFFWPLFSTEEVQNLSWIRFRQNRISQRCIGCGDLHVEMAKRQGQLLLYWAFFTLLEVGWDCCP